MNVVFRVENSIPRQEYMPTGNPDDTIDMATKLRQ